MNRKTYQETAERISRTLNTRFAERFSGRVEYQSILQDYLKKRIHLNGLQFYAGFISAGGTDWETFIDVPIALELVMLWAYKTNRILDKKQDVWIDEERIKQTALDHDLLLSCVFDIVDSSAPQILVKIVHSLMKKLAHGFALERAALCTRFTPLEQILRNWNEAYVERNTLFNAVYDIAPLVGIACATDDTRIIDAYEQEMEPHLRFSHIGQIINDLGDFGDDIDVNVKTYQDTYADIRNGIITFPIQRLIHCAPFRDALANPDIIAQSSWRLRASELIKEHHIQEEICTLAQTAIDAHVQFYQRHLHTIHPLLLRCYGMLFNNKFFDQNRIALTSDFAQAHVITCTASGKETGTCHKSDALANGLRYKTYSILIQNEHGKILIQQQSGKRDLLFGHHVPGQRLNRTVEMALQNLAGVQCAVQKKCHFNLCTHVDNARIHYTHHTVFVGALKSTQIPHNINVAWVSAQELQDDIRNRPERYTESSRVILERVGMTANAAALEQNTVLR